VHCYAYQRESAQHYRCLDNVCRTRHGNQNLWERWSSTLREELSTKWHNQALCAPISLIFLTLASFACISFIFPRVFSCVAFQTRRHHPIASYVTIAIFIRNSSNREPCAKCAPNRSQYSILELMLLAPQSIEHRCRHWGKSEGSSESHHSNLKRRNRASVGSVDVQRPSAIASRQLLFVVCRGERGGGRAAVTHS